MSETFYLAMAVVLSLLGMCWLALSMDVHWAQTRQIALADNKPPRKLLKVLGSLALLLSLALCLLADRPSIAVLVWVMLMAGSAAFLAWGLSKKPQVLKVCWPF
ncbi:DUF3325 domain-containing protein [Limnobacter parvus]|uniref:DUF3325 domain-containing protein n=1 Tax=Limnobacter parvus TaxID=2939690 RepID=A0ABT1XLU6_9BURK|nr:DUF3325 domain-containing protein [Limnobacter parvus]MCR2747841.1 DUF3325 domain-containing protein [Limnobacter parvus]